MYDGALNGKTFLCKKFITECNNDHERRAFCFWKITDSDIPDADKYGQCATEIVRQNNGWGSKECFDDFAETSGLRFETNGEKV